MQTKTDAEIQQDVVSELQWDVRLDAAEIGVAVHHGVVTLIGNAASYARRKLAAKAAHRVACVRDVANDIEVVVNGSKYTDSEIAESVRHAFEWDARVPHEQIKSTVSHGMVQLNGEVDTPEQRADAARAIRNLVGVRGVVNEITTRHAAIARSAVLAEIKQALERHIARDLHHIDVDVDEAKVTVSGKVHSWADWRAVIGAARGTRGVTQVIDHLHIERR